MNVQDIIDLIHPHQGLLAYFCIVALGYALQKFGFITNALTMFLSKSLVRVLYPCLIFHSITSQYSRSSLLTSWPLPLAAFCLLFLGFTLGKGFIKTQGPMSATDRGTFRFMTVMPNYIFVPLPICAALWGDKGVASLIFSTLGAELGMWLLAVPQVRPHVSALRGLLTPPLFALTAALIVVALDTPLWAKELLSYNETFGGIGQGAVPVSLALLGCHFGKTQVPFRSSRHWSLLSYRLILIPICTLIILKFVELPSLHEKIIFLVSTMPPAVASVIISEMFGGNPKLAAEQVMIAHLFALVTVPLWLYYGLNLL